MIAAVERSYPPIGDYALIGDTCTGALIARSGSLDWCCLPDFDSPSVFAAIVDRLNGGRLHIAPVGEARITRRYRGAAPILETRFETATGVLRLTDAMPLIEGSERMLEPQREILRHVEVDSGTVEVEVLAAPRPCYGKAPRIVQEARSVWTIRSGRDALMLHSDLPLREAGGRLHGRARLTAGERRLVSLSFSAGEIAVRPTGGPEARAKIDQTEDWWQHWADGLHLAGRYREPVLRSAQVLRMLCFGHSGAMLAAPTMGLPESIGGALNWDYRYCWLRDSAYIVRALDGVGQAREAQPFLRWLLHATRMTLPRLAAVYDVYGRTLGGERVQTRFEGYRGSGPVRSGNAVGPQLQLDVYGSVIRAVDHYTRSGGRLDAAERRILRRLGDRICRIWRRPDNGIWESRGPRRHTTYGKAMCWCALHTLIDMARRGVVDVPVDRFRAEAETIRDHVLGDGWNPRRRTFTAAFGHDDLDAAVLTLPLIGIVEPDDPRMLATFETIDRELGHGAFVHRTSRPPAAGAETEGSFGVCAFWAVEYLALLGREDEARARFETLLACANDVGLFGEEIDAESGAALGNFPQALTHVGVINAALALERAGQERAA